MPSFMTTLPLSKVIDICWPIIAGLMFIPMISKDSTVQVPRSCPATIISALSVLSPPSPAAWLPAIATHRRTAIPRSERFIDVTFHENSEWNGN